MLKNAKALAARVAFADSFNMFSRNAVFIEKIFGKRYEEFVATSKKAIVVAEKHFADSVDNGLWMMQYIRYMLCLAIQRQAAQQQEIVPKPLNMAQPKNNDVYLARGIDALKATQERIDNFDSQFTHFFSFLSPKDFDFRNKMWLTVHKELEAAEKEWQKKSAECTTQTGTVILTFDDGYEWVDLHCPYSREEGNAMGHCGNVTDVDNDKVTLLSLRKQVRQKVWRPVATFALNLVDGSLGEMKGRANKKPSEKYHRYIVELLKHDSRIKEIVGGGYLPANNFSVLDLDNKNLRNLYATKPEHIDNLVTSQEPTSPNNLVLTCKNGFEWWEVFNDHIKAHADALEIDLPKSPMYLVLRRTLPNSAKVSLVIVSVDDKNKIESIFGKEYGNVQGYMDNVVDLLTNVPFAGFSRGLELQKPDQIEDGSFALYGNNGFNRSQEKAILAANKNFVCSQFLLNDYRQSKSDATVSALIKHIKELFPESKNTLFIENTNLVIFSWYKDLKEFTKDLGFEDMQNYASFLDGDDYLEFDINLEHHEHEIVGLLDSLPDSENLKAFALRVLQSMVSSGELDDEEDLTLDTLSDDLLFKAICHDYTLHDIFYSALLNGYENGTMAAIEQSIASATENSIIEAKSVNVKSDGVLLVISEKKFCDVLEKDNFLAYAAFSKNRLGFARLLSKDIIDDSSLAETLGLCDIHVPYSGFTEYDEKAALEALLDRIGELHNS